MNIFIIKNLNDYFFDKLCVYFRKKKLNDTIWLSPVTIKIIADVALLIPSPKIIFFVKILRYT
jgi:hypothetical protein